MERSVFFGGKTRQVLTRPGWVGCVTGDREVGERRIAVMATGNEPVVLEREEL